MRDLQNGHSMLSPSCRMLSRQSEQRIWPHPRASTSLFTVSSSQMGQMDIVLSENKPVQVRMKRPFGNERRSRGSTSLFRHGYGVERLSEAGGRGEGVFAELASGEWRVRRALRKTTTSFSSTSRRFAIESTRSSYPWIARMRTGIQTRSFVAIAQERRVLLSRDWLWTIFARSVCNKRFWLFRGRRLYEWHGSLSV